MHHIYLLPSCNNQMKGLLNKYMAEVAPGLNVFLKKDEHCPGMVWQQEGMPVEWVPMRREIQVECTGHLHDRNCLICSNQKLRQLQLFQKPVNELLLLNFYRV